MSIPEIEAFLGFGSNIGSREENLIKVLALLKSCMEILTCSSIYETEPVGYKEQPLFLNMVCKGNTDLSPELLLATIKNIEKEMGRKPSFRNAPRIIDIDILFYGNQIINTPDLIVPHPGLVERAFVLLPLVEIAPDFIHPVKREKISRLVDAVAGKDTVKYHSKIKYQDGEWKCIR